MKIEKFQDVFLPFFMFSKVFGFATFCYPSDRFKMSIIGFFCGVLNVLIWLSLSYFSAKEVSTRPKDSNSEVFQVGIVMIRALILLTIIACQIINFSQRKEIFQILKLFEKFDKVVSKNL